MTSENRRPMFRETRANPTGINQYSGHGGGAPAKLSLSPGAKKSYAHGLAKQAEKDSKQGLVDWAKHKTQSSSGMISKSAAAAKMFGKGSKQHKAAIKRFGA